jgi:hypothetical protein
MEIVGIMNEEILWATPWGVVTAIGPSVAPAGTVAVIWAELTTEKEADEPLNVTKVALSRLAPLIVTTVPADPLAGVKEEMLGAPAAAVGVTEAQVVPTRMLPRRNVGAAVELPWRNTTESMFA